MYYTEFSVKKKYIITHSSDNDLLTISFNNEVNNLRG
jgi:hypothetical protein